MKTKIYYRNENYAGILFDRIIFLFQSDGYKSYMNGCVFMAQPTNPVGRVYGFYPKTVAKRYMKKGMSLTPFTCARKHLIFEFSDSAEAFV